MHINSETDSVRGEAAWVSGILENAISATQRQHARLRVHQLRVTLHTPPD